MYNLIILVSANRCMASLQSMISSIGSIHGVDSFGMSVSSVRYNLLALSKFSSIGCMLCSFVPNVACTRYFIAVSSCSCNVGGWSSVGSSIPTVCMSVVFVSVFFTSGSFCHLGSFLLNLACRSKSVRFPSVLVSQALVIVFFFGWCFSLSRYGADELLIFLSTLVFYAASILLAESHSG